MPHKTELDHLVIVAPTLAAGAEYVRRALGVEPQAGGTHASMGTHNLLLRVGESCYLEIIAIDPAAPRPQRRRWFDMDSRPADAPARLTTWVARTDDLNSALAACPLPPGEILPMTRGMLEWRITVPADGHLPGGGVLPTLIQWNTDNHPAQGLKNVGVNLLSLTLHHPEPVTCEASLKALNFAGPVTVAMAASALPSIEARFDTPQDQRVLHLIDHTVARRRPTG